MPELAEVIGDTSFPIRASDRSRELDDRLKDGGVCVAEMAGFVGNGSSDDIIPIKAAIAKALSEGKGCVILPNGANIAVSESIFLGYEADQTNPSFSLALIKPGASGNHEAQGGWIVPLTDDFTAVKVGPGQGMYVDGVTIRWGGDYRALQNEDSISFAVAAESGGTSRFTFRNCHAYGGYTMFDVGSFGAGALADSGMFDSCSGDNIVYGYKFSNTQAYIQTIHNNRINAKNIVYAALGHNVNIFSGNYSGVESKANQHSITNVSALTATASGNGYYYDFTAEVTDEDSDLASGLIYDDAVIDDAQWGLIPLTITGYNSGTNILSLRTILNWSLFNGQSTNLKTGTNLETRIQAATTIGVGERLTTFWGTGINQKGSIHLENASGYTRFLEANAGFDTGNTISTFDNVYANYDVGAPQDGNGTKQAVKRRLQRSHPFINLYNGGVVINGMRLSQLTANGCPLVIDVGGTNLLQVRNCVSWLAPSVRCYVGQDAFTSGYEGPSSGVGTGDWYPTPFRPQTANSIDVNSRTIGWNRTEHFGWFPRFDTTPRLTPSQVTTVTGSLPTFVTGGNVSYPLIAGGTNYSVGTPAETDSNVLFIKSKHKFYSYGQDLTTTNITNLAWSFYGKTRKLVVNVEAFERLFPGLGIFLAHASINSGTPFECVITSCDKAGLFVEVSSLGWLLPGTAGTQYTGTTIGQAAYSFKTVTGS